MLRGEPGLRSWLVDGSNREFGGGDETGGNRWGIGFCKECGVLLK